MTPAQGLGQTPSPPPSSPRWGPFVEPGTPFFGSVLDVRKLSTDSETNNLTPRGVILNLGSGCWACFDLDLLRVTALWHGAGVTPVSMSQGSYHIAAAKAREGQSVLPQLDGTPWIICPPYPGWQAGEAPRFQDPRDPGLDEREIGRGPLPARLGRFARVDLSEDGVVLAYEAAGVAMEERLRARTANGITTIQRTIEIGAHDTTLWLLLGRQPQQATQRLQVRMMASLNSGPEAASLIAPTGTGDVWRVKLPRAASACSLRVAISLGESAETWVVPPSATPPAARWGSTVTTRGTPGDETVAWAVDDIALPWENPWRRNLRFADLAFAGPGRAAAVTYDGDVWFIDGLVDGLNRVRWRRYGSGFHEPLGLCFRDGELFVNDRNGIWRLKDRDRNAEADSFELFSNAFTQTAETREFATGIRALPDGSFIISKGGLQSATHGRHNGCVLRVAPDGRSSEVLGWGFRMPFIGVHPVTGLVTASDQQGNYVPTTPLYRVTDHRFHGFLAPFEPKERYPAEIASPLAWLPHAFNSSGASQVWLSGGRMGPLNEALIHIGYYRPELFVVRWDPRDPSSQAAVVSLTRQFEFSPLNGALNPADGQLYVIGLQIWGTVANRISGLARIRHTGAENLLVRSIHAHTQGILLRFDRALSASSATNLGNYSVERWNYARTANYGSPHFRLDGTKGQETLPVSSAYLSTDRKSVFIGVRDMRPVMQMRVGWTLATETGRNWPDNAYFSISALEPLDLPSSGLNVSEIDLSQRGPTAAIQTPVTAEEGRRLADLMGCVACHSTDGGVLGKTGPTWKGLFGSERVFSDKTRSTADEAYLRESMLEPTRRVVAGFETSDVGMPSYAGVLTDAQIEALVLHIHTLR